MKTNFIEYYNKRQNIDSLFESVVLEAQNNPELYKLLDEAGFWSNLGSAVKQFGQNVWSGGGIKGGWTQAKDTVTGPKAKYDSAVASLQQLVKTLQSDERTRNMMTSDNRTDVGTFINGVIKQLQQQKEMIPVMTPQATTQPTPQQPGRAAPPPGP
jgi:hypothetical protein